MGLSYDPNKKIHNLNTKQEMLKEAVRKVKENSSDEDEMDVTPSKNYVAEKLEAEIKAPKHRRLKLPKQQAQFLTYLIQKYGEDYKVRFSLKSLLSLIMANYILIAANSLCRQWQKTKRTIIN